jgi:hypothetical protein
MPRLPGVVVFGASLAILLLARSPCARAEETPANTVQEMVAKLKQCWKPPALSRSSPGMELTVMVSFTRHGAIFGHPRIVHESPDASDDDRLQYRLALMKTLESCTPVSLTGGLGDAVAGRPFRIRFDGRKRTPKPTERTTWLIPKIL